MVTQIFYFASGVSKISILKKMTSLLEQRSRGEKSCIKSVLARDPFDILTSYPILEENATWK